LKFKFIALNTLLLIAILAIVWQARARWREAQLRREANLNVAVRPVPLPPLAPVPKPDTPPAARYADVATKDLFAKDRNPVVIVDPPKIEKPKEMPPLPVVFGVLALPSGTRAIMAERKNEPSLPVHQGDTVGEFTIVSLDPRNVTFGWEGKQISRKIDDLIDRSGPPNNAGAGAANPQAAAPVQVNSQPQQQFQQQQSSPVQTGNVQPGAATIGIEIGAPGHSERACTPGDGSPAGTVIDGYKKTTASSPFGIICRWVPAQ
jgi:hypothetical protein